MRHTVTPCGYFYIYKYHSSLKTLILVSFKESKAATMTQAPRIFASLDLV